MTIEARMEFPDFTATAPGVTQALSALAKAVDDSGLGKPLTELIKIRASQINGCAFCLQFHLNAARKAGVTATKIDLVAVWRDAGIFTEREIAALAWTESLTHVTPAGISDHAFEDARRKFSDSELALLTSAVAAINAWNRIAIAYRFTPPIPQDRAGE
jgi:AhpD family alkylhydroperoxidase